MKEGLETEDREPALSRTISSFELPCRTTQQMRVVGTNPNTRRTSQRNKGLESSKANGRLSSSGGRSACVLPDQADEFLGVLAGLSWAKGQDSGIVRDCISLVGVDDDL